MGFAALIFQAIPAQMPASLLERRFSGTHQARM
jgi:hypothetical protein